MPYFQRKPIEGLIDAVLSNVSTSGLPSRGRTPVVAAGRLAHAPATITGIVEQAASVLASERPGISPGLSARADAGSVPTAPSSRVNQLQEQVNVLVERLVTLAGQPSGSDVAASHSKLVTGREAPSDSAHLIIEPAPVLSSPGPVAPGGTAQICISLVNEDEQPAQITFLSIGLIGEDGGCVPPERISFQPRELTLPPGKTSEVTVRVVIPAQMRCGVYSGLVRASKLDYLHAVLVVQVEYS